MSSILYSHRQVNPLFFILLSLGFFGAIAAVIINHQPWLVLPILGVFAFIVLLFSSLSIEVSTDRLRFWYGIGIIRWDIPLSDIASVTRTRSYWYEGWGIRLTFRGWLYNWFGNDCVEIQRKSRRPFRLGTPEPDRLVMVLQQALLKSPSS